jgi:hypothetical protein
MPHKSLRKRLTPLIRRIDDPAYLAGRERQRKGMRLAGLPEG